MANKETQLFSMDDKEFPLNRLPRIVNIHVQEKSYIYHLTGQINKIGTVGIIDHRWSVDITSSFRETRLLL